VSRVCVPYLRLVSALMASHTNTTYPHKQSHSANATSEVRLWGARLPRAVSNHPSRIMLPESIGAESQWFKTNGPRPMVQDLIVKTVVKPQWSRHNGRFQYLPDVI